MARYDEAHKAEAQRLIVRHAAERFRRDGIAAVGVRQLMADVGMTHGGFYTHFASRDDLVAAAIERAAQSTLGYLEEAVTAAAPSGALDAFIATYLGERHLTEMARGCAASALAPEVARQDEAARSRFKQQNDRIIALLERTLPEGGDKDARSARATAIFACLMGTLQLARIASAPQDIEQILAGGRAAATSLAHQAWR